MTTEEQTNEKRRERAYSTVLAYHTYAGLQEEDVETAIVDLVTDLLHLSDQYGVEADYVTRVALVHYNAERFGDDLEVF